MKNIIAFIFLFCVGINAQDTVKVNYTGEQITAQLSNLLNSDSTQFGDAIFYKGLDASVFIQTESGLDYTEGVGEKPQAPFVFLTSNDNWWTGATFRNYYNSGYSIGNGNNRGQSAGEFKSIVQGTGTPASISGLNVLSTLTNFTGTYPWGVYGISAYIQTPNANLSSNPGNIMLFNGTISGGSAEDTIQPSSKFRGYSLIVSGSTNQKFSGLTSYYSDLTSGKMIGNNYHFYGNGDVPSYFGGDVEVNGDKLKIQNIPSDSTQCSAGELYWFFDVAGRKTIGMKCP